MRTVTATWDAGEGHWVHLTEPADITDFRWAVENSRAMGVSWDGASQMRKVLDGLTGEQLDQVGRLVEQLRPGQRQMFTDQAAT